MSMENLQRMGAFSTQFFCFAELVWMGTEMCQSTGDSAPSLNLVKPRLA